MKKKEKKREISDIKTACCNADWYIRSRGNYRCEKCDGDIALQILYYGMLINDSKKK